MDKPRREGLRGICAGGSEALAEGNGVGMMVAERAMAPGATAPCSDQNNQAESNTPEPTPATCGTCKAVEGLYILGSGFLCVGCIGAAVSMAANDLWPDLVSYSREFESVIYD